MKKSRPTRLILFCLLLAGSGVPAFLSQAASAPKTGKKKVTATSVRGKSGKTKSSRRQVGQKAPTAERVSEIQQALAKDGSYAGPPNGKWDGSTIDAMKKFQAGHGLNPSGKLDAKTLQQLGLGSHTAGVGAPTYPVRVSSTGVPQGDNVKQGASNQ